MMGDQELWQKLKGGDKDSLRRIYDLHVESMLQYSFRITPHEDLIQDCIHDLFVEIWKNRERLGMTSSIRPYLLVSLRRKLVRAIQKGNKTQELAPDLNFGLSPGAEEVLIKGEESALQSEKLKTALSQLSHRQREAIFLKYYEEMEYQEVAEAMNINYQSVRNLIFSGIKKLREVLVMILCSLIFFDQI